MYIASLLECGGYSVVNAFKAFEGQLDYFKSIAYMAVLVLCMSFH